MDSDGSDNSDASPSPRPDSRVRTLRAPSLESEDETTDTEDYPLVRQPSTSPELDEEPAELDAFSPSRMPILNQELPNELIRKIIRASLPPLRSLRGISKRYETLRSYCLVCQAWLSIAQPELFYVVDLTRRSSLQEFLGIVHGMDRRGLADDVHILRVQGPTGSTRKLRPIELFEAVLEKTLVACPRIEDLSVDEVVVDPAILSWSVGLKIFRLSNTMLRYPAATQKERFTWRFPVLTTLLLHNVHAVDHLYCLVDSTTYLNKRSLPSLTTLAINSSPTIPMPILYALDLTLLTALYIDRKGTNQASVQGSREGATLLPQTLPLCNALKHLAVDICYRADLVLLAALPSQGTVSLDSLRLDEHQSGIISIIEPELFNKHFEKHELKKLVLPVGERSQSVAKFEVRELTKKWCVEKGIELVEMEYLQTDVEDWLRDTVDVRR